MAGAEISQSPGPGCPGELSALGPGDARPRENGETGPWTHPTFESFR